MDQTDTLGRLCCLCNFDHCFTKWSWQHKFISGYNTASKEEKARYDEKKLCRVYGIGMGVIAILLLITGLFESFLPSSFVYVLLVLIVIDVVIIIILSNTICKR